MVGDVTIEWELPDGGLYIMPSRHGAAAAFPGPGKNNFRLVRAACLACTSTLTLILTLHTITLTDPSIPSLLDFWGFRRAACNLIKQATHASDVWILVLGCLAGCNG